MTELHDLERLVADWRKAAMREEQVADQQAVGYARGVLIGRRNVHREAAAELAAVLKGKT